MSAPSLLRRLLDAALRSPQMRRAAQDLGRRAADRLSGRDEGSSAQRPSTQSPPAQRASAGASARHDRPGALRDRRSQPPLRIDYAPHPDGIADPGEIVWTWVPFEEDPARGKDRPVLVLAEEDAAVGGPDGRGRVLIALMLTSRDRAPRDGVATDEHGATWVDIGSGAWDRDERPSEVRADRLLRVQPDGVRREAAGLDRARFERVAAAVREIHGWR